MTIDLNKMFSTVVYAFLWVALLLLAQDMLTAHIEMLERKNVREIQACIKMNCASPLGVGR